MRKKITLALLSLLLVPLAMMAQDVTISPTTGNLMAALTQEGEEGSAKGWSSTWKHNQLALTLTVSDFCNLTEGGESANPAGNIIQRGDNYVFVGGANPDLYMTISLPKGFRFTGYEIVLLNNLGGETVGGSTVRNCNKIFYETTDLSYYSTTTTMVYDNAHDADNYTTIRNAINSGDSHYLAVAKNAAGYNYTSQNNEGDTEYTITRTSKEDDGSDMGNHLYFRMSRGSATLGGMTIKSARFYFTAEGNFTESVSPKAEPTSITTTGVNYMYAPFKTGKLDLGEVSLDENGHYTYKYFNVHDLEANNVIYESGAVTTAGALPATPGAGGIYGVYNDGKYYYGLKNNATDAYYFVECPTTAPAEGGGETPVGFRITGAKVHYAYGVDATGGPEPIIEKYDEFTISYTYRGTPYYLGNGYGRSQTATNWFMDEEGYVRCGTSGSSYLTIASRNVQQGWSSYTIYYMTTTSNVSEAVKFKRNGGYLLVDGGDFNNYYVSYGNQSAGNDEYYWRLRGNTNNSPVTVTNTGTQASITVGTVNVPAFTAKPYTLTVYQKDGTNIEETVYVGEAGTTVTIDGVEHQRVESGTVTLNHINNDAIKFKIEGLPADAANTNYKALVTVELTMQALDPYIDNMTVVCKDPYTEPELRITRPFTASDFSVSGGVFDFYLPSKCSGHEVQITFEDLYSHYADESYTQENDGFNGSSSHFSRYNFVNSLHYQEFTSGGDNNIYNDYDEAADPQEERLKVSGSGTKAFKFNNAADVSAGRADYFIEYPFSLAEYGESNFKDLKFTVSATSQSDTRYVFTTDETAYNIAPTTAYQHRAYAFYTMKVNVHSSTYTPHVKFLPIYNKNNKTVYGNREQNDFYGVEVTAPYTEGGVTKQGYAQTDQIFAIIDAAVKGSSATGTVKDDKNVTIGTYEGWASGLTSATQLLYLDFSPLAGVFQVTTEQHGSMDDYSGTNAPNCMIFLPVGASAPNNNVAYKTSATSNIFRAAHDIVLTDKQPFYSPYDIQVGSENMAYYEREVTVPKNGKVTSASIIMPFDISIDGSGKHTNYGENTWAFSIHEMQQSECLDGDVEAGAAAYVYFPALEGAKTSKANYPYLVKVNEANLPADHDGKQFSFVLSQRGATLKASTSMASDYTFTGGTATGTDTKDGKSFKFTAHGSYSGKLLPYEGFYYYYSANMFVRSNEYKYKTDIRVTPFRGYYSTEGITPTSKLTAFDVIFEEGEGNTPSGIETVNSLHNIDVNAPVYDVQGRKLANSLIGTTLKRGIYVIDGVKFVVK